MMKPTPVVLAPLCPDDREQFILDNQWAFLYGARQEFGMRDNHLEEDGQVISRRSIQRSLDAAGSAAYRILLDGRKVGGVVLHIDCQTHHNHLDLLFVSPEAHSKGVGFAAWQAVEALYPETVVWETFTPYFEKRNIHFYINKCGFHAVEFFGQFHAMKGSSGEQDDEGPDEMFRFVKYMRPQQESDPARREEK